MKNKSLKMINLKKYIIAFVAMIFCFAFLLTGCATVSNVYDRDGNPIYFDELVYFQGQIAKIGDYIYYGNSYSNSSSDDFNYSTASSTGYLARLNVSGKLGYDYTADEDGYVDPSPANVEKVNGRLTGYQNQNMFALGNYLYFTSANTHRDSDMQNDYTQVSLFRIKFNGDGLSEIETFRFDENSLLTIREGSDGNYYYIAYIPSSSGDSPTYNLYSIRIGNSIGDLRLLAEDVLSIAVCDENSQVKNIVYTVNSDRTTHATTAVRGVDFATGEITEYGNNTEVTGSTVEMKGRSGDIVFYSYQTTVMPAQIYYKVLKSDGTGDDQYFSGTESRWFYNAEDIEIIGYSNDGYIFIPSSSSSVMYKKLDQSLEQTQPALLTSSDYSDILFIDGDYIYYSNDTSISRVSVLTRQTETIVAMTSIISGQCGYSDGYIYFYAQLESDEESSEDSESDSSTSDTNYYLYRVQAGVNPDGNTQLMSKVEKP